ncbi:MAG: glycosyltransferase family 2 protein [Flavobacteriaceae bacterium]|jgi:glycosyltransferase involved in cell wall biosynthesis|nr:glycosyltransferase family 2 protein [Flavobacteriaceae bacterium]
MNRISGVIIAFNEEKHIEKCLLSLKKVVDEIVVIDSFSTDKTVEICEQHGAKVIQHPFSGYTDQKNYAISQAKYEYVLSLDADEALSDELTHEILLIKDNLSAEGYSFNILNNHCGQWIKHSGWYPGTKIRLFNKHKAKWFSPTNLHETIKLDNNNSIVHLKGDLLHWAYDSYSEHFLKIDNYTSLAAKFYVQNVNKKISLTKIIINPFWTFFKSYIIKRGFLDGFEGFVISIFGAIATFLKYIKIIQLQKAQK